VKLRLVWTWETGVTQRERESVAVLSGGELDRGRGAAMCVCLAENWAEEGELQCGSVWRRTGQRKGSCNVGLFGGEFLYKKLM